METQHDLATDSAEDRFKDMRDSKPWLESIKSAEKYYHNYNEKCDKIDKLYADLKTMSEGNGEREFQIFWANLEVLKPAIYARSPVPVVQGRFKDRKPIIRHASEILERSLTSSFEFDDLHSTMKSVRDDLAVNGRGVPWCRYEVDDKGDERVAYDHVDRKDFLMQECRKWRECGWVARATYHDIDTMRARFEEHSGLAFTQANYQDKTDDTEGVEDYAGTKKCKVWELWSRDRNVVVWVSEGVDTVLDISDPFLSLDKFYPCPKPAMATVERNTMRPVPDFVYYKDQVEEVNELTARISALSEGLRLKGFYAGGAEDVAEAIESAIKAQDNNAILIPVSNFGALGGASLKDTLVWMPIDQVVQTIQALVELRRQLIEDIYEITGLSDIMRGNTDASETLGAQQLKSQYGSSRIKDKQEELQRVARDITLIAAEIMAENFDPQTLLDMSQYDELRPQQVIQAEMQQVQLAAQSDPQAQARLQELQQEVPAEAVFQFLRDERIRPFVLDIETDSTIQPDEDALKQRSNEFLGALSGAMAQLGPMIQTQPETAPFAGEVLKFAVQPYRAGRQLEAQIDEFVDQAKEMAKQPQPNPEQERLQMEQQAKQAELEMKQQDMQASNEAKQAELAMKQEENASKAEFEATKLNIEREKLDIERERLGVEVSRAAAESEHRDKDRRSKDNEKLVANGMPPDYSFDSDREQFADIMQRLEQSSEKSEAMFEALIRSQTELGNMITMLAEIQKAPKRITTDENGEPTGVEVVLN